MIRSVLNLQLFLGVLLIAASIPLALRMVPMNPVYGVRVPEAYASESNWYAINAFGGRLLTGLGAILVVSGVVGQLIALDPRSPWALVFFAGPPLALVPVLTLVIVFARRLPRN
jgi:uncharacterized membrane protein